MPKDSPGQIDKLQLNTMGYSGQASVQPIMGYPRLAHHPIRWDSMS